MDEKLQNIKQFQKKVYTRLSKSDLASLNLSESINSCNEPSNRKKIVATSIGQNVREEFKKTFLPLLVEVFELRQMIKNHHNQTTDAFMESQPNNSLKDIINRLEVLKKEIEETKRWCDGVSIQIEKGLQEASDSSIHDAEPKRNSNKITTLKSKYILDKLFNLIKKIS